MILELICQYSTNAIKDLNVCQRGMLKFVLKLFCLVILKVKKSLSL